MTDAGDTPRPRFYIEVTGPGWFTLPSQPDAVFCVPPEGYQDGPHPDVSGWEELCTTSDVPDWARSNPRTYRKEWRQ